MTSPVADPQALQSLPATPLSDPPVSPAADSDLQPFNIWLSSVLPYSLWSSLMLAGDYTHASVCIHTEYAYTLVSSIADTPGTWTPVALSPVAGTETSTVYGLCSCWLHRHVDPCDSWFPVQLWALKTSVHTHACRLERPPSMKNS